jgi:hypothetical protein
LLAAWHRCWCSSPSSSSSSSSSSSMVACLTMTAWCCIRTPAASACSNQWPQWPQVRHTTQRHSMCSEGYCNCLCLQAGRPAS